MVPDYYFARSSSSELMGGQRANASLVMLARNSDLEGAVKSMQRLEDRFNR
jgi:alpha 1,2-mannosyltransferase